MDFITGLPKSKKHNYSIFLVVDKLSKETHFIQVNSTYKVVHIIGIFLKEIFQLHGIPKATISDRDKKFTSNFQRSLFSVLETQLNCSTFYHPQTDGQTERVNQILEDMIRMYVMNNPTKWEDYLHLVEFAYNNGYHNFTKMSPFEVLYGRKCRTPVTWDSPVDMLMLRPDLLKDLEQLVIKVKPNLKEAQDRKKSHVAKKIKDKYFQVGEHVYLKVKEKRSSLSLGRCKKLAPIFCGPFEILTKRGTVAYELDLPPHIKVHNFFTHHF